jgi:hypothetical protein
LSDGYAKTFIASASNSGTATTINGLPLYKPNTTTAPTLIAGKAYTVWYSLSGSCFFLKASAEGTATADKVLAPYIFSNDSDTGLIGTIVSKSAQTYTPSTSAQTIASGQYLSDVQTIAATTGTATVDDVTLGKTFNSAAGIGLTGTYVGKRYKAGSWSVNSTDAGTFSNVLSGLVFTASQVIVSFYGTTYRGNGGTGGVGASAWNAGQSSMIPANGIYANLSCSLSNVTSTGCTINVSIGSGNGLKGTITYLVLE